MCVGEKMLIHIEYVDGTDEVIESKKGTNVTYEEDMRCFRFVTYDDKIILIHRDFVKKIGME